MTGKQHCRLLAHGVVVYQAPCLHVFPAAHVVEGVRLHNVQEGFGLWLWWLWVSF